MSLTNCIRRIRKMGVTTNHFLVKLLYNCFHKVFLFFYFHWCHVILVITECHLVCFHSFSCKLKKNISFVLTSSQSWNTLNKFYVHTCAIYMSSKVKVTDELEVHHCQKPHPSRIHFIHVLTLNFSCVREVFFSINKYLRN